MREPTEKRQIIQLTGKSAETKPDLLAVEEPLEIRLLHWKNSSQLSSSIAVTMRTPGSDEFLALGFLFSEGIITDARQVLSVRHVRVRNELASGNAVEVALAQNVSIDFKKLQRHFYTSSSCGVCGKASIEAVQGAAACPVLPENFVINRTVLYKLCHILNERQTIFRDTGGLHASALFDTDGNLLQLQEDVGRHNALDKIIGYAFKNDLLPLSRNLLLVSGRTSFELVQKAAMAGISVLAAVGAPSSLAAQLAEETGLTLIGFLKNEKCNIYANPGRVE
ncbi:MAG TPA: formate dehydrogenase accessory sulfurtransferase FdhD [Saprospiraceae bacterium]|nr:formate dehydrogenase accessory sulfurtransferase FdhD [Saprospiraceae bacterium]